MDGNVDRDGVFDKIETFEEEHCRELFGDAWKESNFPLSSYFIYSPSS